eukprot:INCI5517.1.p1 GENE.INCI5517.1~~INCI5517.1.p1  ORF type:complete len:711 (-),score=149.77 INCI5517.1:58-2100(-)
MSATAAVHARLSQILDAAPASWHGTTYPNDYRYRGRTAFVKEMLRLLHGSDAITTEHLAEFFPEDYVRLGSPFSTLLEVATALERGFDPYTTYVFGSRTLSLISVLMAVRGAPVFVYHDAGTEDCRLWMLSEEQEELLQTLYGCKFTRCEGPPQSHGENAVVVVVSDGPRSELGDACVDAVVSTDGFVFVQHAGKVPPEDVVASDGTRVEGVHTMRKRLGAATPTPEAIQRLRGEPLDETPDTAALEAHLKELAGAAPDGPGRVVLSTVGLAALAAVVMASLEIGERNIDSVMCSTAYGGSSQQTDILSTRTFQVGLVHMERHKFNIQGAAADVFKSLRTTLNAMKASESRKPLTLVQIEYPTNPDMKDCDLAAVEEELQQYQAATGSQVLLLLDTTFSPPSKPLQQFRATGNNAIPTLVFNSLSKSVTGGFTTGGSVVANDTPLAQEVLRCAHKHMSLLDTRAKNCQLLIFNKMHSECETRVRQAHDNCVRAAAAFERAVERFSGQRMPTNFVTDAQIAKGVTPATFSFNLPPPQGEPDEATRAAFAQRFVDSLANSPFGKAGGVKPCVSFGQKNSTVYATVPATSTQGVISKELTAKQALGGIQLIRFSFPTNMDHDAWESAVDHALSNAYSADGGIVTAPKPSKAPSVPVLLVAGAVFAALVAGTALVFKRSRQAKK